MNGKVLPFGKYSGSTISRVPSSYLRWLSTKINTDLNYWAEIATQELSNRNEDDDLEAMADEFLRQNGVNPNDC